MTQRRVRLQNEVIARENFEALMSSNLYNAGFSGTRSMLNFEQVNGSTINQNVYRAQEMEAVVDDDLDECLNHLEKKRRLTTNQVELLEKSFEVDNKLEPERRIGLAKELGMQPRQVAIWFQNRRARWKTKHLEREYEILKSSYDALKADYEKVLMEKENLTAEVVHLTEKLLLKEKHESNNVEAPELDNKPDYNSEINVHLPENQIVEVKLENQSSMDSVVSESESPYSNDGARSNSSIVFELDQSNISHVEENDVEAGGYHQFLKLDRYNSANLGFLVEDHSFWLWS